MLLWWSYQEEWDRRLTDKRNTYNISSGKLEAKISLKTRKICKSWACIKIGFQKVVLWIYLTQTTDNGPVDIFVILRYCSPSLGVCSTTASDVTQYFRIRIIQLHRCGSLRTRIAARNWLLWTFGWHNLQGISANIRFSKRPFLRTFIYLLKIHVIYCVWNQMTRN